MLNNSKSALAIVAVLTATIYMHRPEKNEIKTSPEVEAAINSIDPIPAEISADMPDHYSKITLGNWGRGPIPMVSREWNDGHISRNSLKTKTTLLKRSDAILTE